MEMCTKLPLKINEDTSLIMTAVSWVSVTNYVTFEWQPRYERRTPLRGQV